MQQDDTRPRASLKLAHIRSRPLKPTRELAVLAPFSELFASTISKSLTELSGVAVRASVVEVDMTLTTPEQQAEAGFDLVHASSRLPTWINTERQFELMLCEICLGANGSEPRGEDSERPSSTFERLLRELAVEKICQAAAAAIVEISGDGDISAIARPRRSVKSAGAGLNCYTVKFLLNAHHHASEIEFLVPMMECLLLLSGMSTTGTHNAAPSALSSSCLELDIFSQAELIPADRLFNLSVGSVLAFNVKASAPVEVRLNGAPICDGRMSVADDRHIITLSSPIQAPSQPEQPRLQ